jgi:hypothetical protein
LTRNLLITRQYFSRDSATKQKNYTLSLDLHIKYLNHEAMLINHKEMALAIAIDEHLI